MTIETAAQTFTLAATAYRLWMDSVAADETTSANVRELFSVLSELQSAAAQLPPVRLQDGVSLSQGSDMEESSTDLEDARAASALAEAAASKLPLDAYCTVFDALDSSDRVAIMKNLSNDLGDIYLEISRALALSGTMPLDETVWNWRFSYYTHWGRHIVHALAAVFSERASEGRFFLS